MRYISILLCLFFINIFQLTAATNYSGFLANGIGAKPASMGGAFTAISDNNDAIFWNSAGLGYQTENKLVTLYSNFFGEVDHIWLSYVHITDFGNFGLGYTSMSINGLEERNLNGDKISDFDFNDSSIMLSWANLINPNLSSGINFKIIKQKALLENMSLGLDFSLLYSKNNFRLGFNLQDLIKTKLGTDIQATKMNLGMAYTLNSITVSGDLRFIETQNLDYGIGIEGKILNCFSLTGGYNQNGINLGASINIGSLNLDYSYRNHVLGSINQIEFGVTLR